MTLLLRRTLRTATDPKTGRPSKQRPAARSGWPRPAPPTSARPGPSTVIDTGCARLSGAAPHLPERAASRTKRPACARHGGPPAGRWANGLAGPTERSEGSPPRSRPRRPSRMRGRRACLPAIATRGRSSGLDPQLRQPAWFATASQSPRCEWRCSRYERVAKPAAPTPAAQRPRVGPIRLCAIGRRDAPRCRSGQRRVTAWGVSSAAKASSSPRPSRSAAWAAAMRAIGTR
jgi:hypothetical protein